MSETRGDWGTWAYRVLRRLHLGRLMPPAMARLVRRRVVDMPVSEVLVAVATLMSAGVVVLVAGGWGIDAIVGEQTRRHSDVDLVVRSSQAAAAELALLALGYQVIDRLRGGCWMPDVVVCRNAEGRTVELLPLERLPEATTGSLAGRPVPCLSVGTQVTFHSGYRLRMDDRHDLALLRRHAGALSSATDAG